MSEPRVPLFDLRVQDERLAPEIERAVARVLASGQYVRGGEVAAFERAVAEHCGVVEAVACGSGSDALLLSLMAHGIGPGDRVVCPAFTFFSTAAAIARLGAEPVFADVDPDTLCSGADEVRTAIERSGPPAALLAVHLFGRAAEMDGLVELAGALDVPLVEDAAQSIGAFDSSGRQVGTRGHGGCLSFYPTKNLGGYGDGGMVLCRSADLAARLRVLRDHGEEPSGEHRVVGINSRLDAIQAAVLAAKLPHLDAWNHARQDHAAVYGELLGELGAEAGSGAFDGPGLPLRLPAVPRRPASHVFHHYVVRVPARHREALRAHLADRGVGSGVYYSRPLHQQPCFAGSGGQPPSLPATEAAARESLTIPVHPRLSKDQLAYVVESIRSYFAQLSSAAPSR